MDGPRSPEPKKAGGSCKRAAGADTASLSGLWLLRFTVLVCQELVPRTTTAACIPESVPAPFPISLDQGSRHPVVSGPANGTRATT